MSKFIVLDIVFYGGSLNYDWGGGINYQPLKKITKWDGRQYILVSRYALRYSILDWASKLFPEEWKLADKDILKAEKRDVVRLKSENEIKEEKNKKYKEYKDFLQDVFEKYPEFDLFGFMVAEKGSKQAALTRTSPVKISHAISMTPYNFDSHTMANLGIMKRAGGEGSNPVTIEEKYDFYVYSVIIDVNRVGKFLEKEHGRKDWGDIKISEEKIEKRIIGLIETILNLKRDIKGRREDLSPWIVILGLYNNGKYESYLEKIRLNKETRYRIEITKKKEGNTEIIEHYIKDELVPSFFIDIEKGNKNVYVFYRKNLCKIVPEPTNRLDTKEEIINKIKEFLKS